MSNIRRVASVKNELVEKSKESMLSAVQIFNNPNTYFKSESFIVLIIISWTYLLHAHYRENGIEYRYFKKAGTRRRFYKTKNGAYKYWELEKCLSYNACPVSKIIKENLFFLIGLRHEIEHQMTSRIDDLLSARFQACCLNYNSILKVLFPKIESIDNYLSFSLQFASLSQKQADQLKDYTDLPSNISTYIREYDEKLSEDEFNDSKYSYRVLFVPKTTNRKGQVDKVVEFVDSKSEIAKGLSKEYWVVKDREKKKYLSSQVIKIIQKSGIKDFNQYKHTQLWRQYDAKNPAKGFGTQVVNYWYWYDNWVDLLLDHFGDF